MKKISMLSLALVSGLGFVMAQTTTMDPDRAHQPLRTEMATAARFGVKGGVNFAKLKDKGFPSSNNISTTSKTSLHGGFFANVPLGTSHLRFQPELLYSGQGGKVRSTSSVPGSTATNQEYDMKYLNVPLMLQIHTASSGFFVEVGPQIGFLLSAKTKQQTPSGPDVDIKNRLDKFDLALGGGLGYTTRVGLGFGVRYNYGLRNVLDDKASGYQAGTELKNRVIQAGLFYSFGAAK